VTGAAALVDGTFTAPLSLAVVQPLPGIGDMIWHLPHIRALAHAAGRPVTLVAKPGSLADEIFAADPSVSGFLWLHRNNKGNGGGLRTVLDIARLVFDLRSRRFDAVVLLHHSLTLAASLRLAGIPLRYGYGYGRQRRFLNRAPFLDLSVRRVHPYGQATQWLAAAGIRRPDAEPALPVTAAARAAVSARLPAGPPPVAVGIGSSQPNKQWGATRFAGLIGRLRTSGWPRCVLVGGAAEAGLAAEIQALLPGPAVVAALSWPIGDLAALLADAAFYVGNDTGAANLAAAVGVRTYCLFGATVPFDHSALIVPIVPPEGVDRVGGMAKITVPAVMAAIVADRTALLASAG
jgi:heptosyltransferase II